MKQWFALYVSLNSYGGGVSWSRWMEPWTGIGTSRSWGIKCCHGRRGCLEVTMCTSKTMQCPIQHVTRQFFWTNRMLKSWTGQLGAKTCTQLSMFGIKCQSGSETWMTPSTVTELSKAVRQAWAAVRTGRKRTLVESMPLRVRALMAAKCGHTRY